MRWRFSGIVWSALLPVLCGCAGAASFGTVVPVRGAVSDIALDERRQRLYIANFAANRIEVMRTTDRSLLAPLSVSGPPSSLAVSPDGRYLVVGIDNNFAEAPNKGGYWIFDLDANLTTQVAVPEPVLAVAFGAGSQALLITTNAAVLLDPATARTRPLDPVPSATTVEIPVPFANFPPNIVQASAGVSGDGQTIMVLAATGTAPPVAGGRTSVLLRYRVGETRLGVAGITSAPPLGPRVMTVDRDGRNFIAGWALVDLNVINRAQFAAADGALNIGGHAWDYARNRIFAQVPAPRDNAVLHVVDTDNLTVRERVQLPQNLAGRGVWSSDLSTLYFVSVSGVLVFDVAAFDAAPRVIPLQEDVLLVDETCDRTVVTQTLDLVDPNGRSVDFTLSLPSGAAGIRLSQTSGTTPARIRIEVDPTVYRNAKGTTVVPLTISSPEAINLPPPVRILINTREANQFGRIINVPGKITDILPDRFRNRVYLIRQDKNLVLVYDTATFREIARMRTGNTPVGMAITTDRRYLIVGAENSQIASVFDLETLEPTNPVIFPGGHYPRSVAVSHGAILAIVRNVAQGNLHKVDRIDFAARLANALPSLGVFKNELSSPDGVLVETPGNNGILMALPDGTVALYDAAADTFVASRKDFASLGGAYAALNDNLFLVDNHLLDPALVRVAGVQNASGSSSGASLSNRGGLRTTTGAANAPGTIERVDLATSQTFSGTLTAEAPVTAQMLQTPPVGQIGQLILPFTRTLAVSPDQRSIVLLTVSGITVLGSDFDAPVSTVSEAPSVSSVTSGADGTSGVAPGGLAQILGTGFGANSAAATGFPLPTALAGVCATLSNVSLPLYNVSPGAILAQLPFTASGTSPLIVRAPNGVSAPFSVDVQSFAPAVFRTGEAGDQTGLPTVIRHKNAELATFTNPIHPDETISIYLTGMGLTTPLPRLGDAAPESPLALVTTPPRITLGGTELPVLFAGLVPGLAGVYQIDAYVPRNIPGAAQAALVITQGASSTSLPLRVVNP
jgi:uncharacterized protein (TIGR03437 family)